MMGKESKLGRGQSVALVTSETTQPGQSAHRQRTTVPRRRWVVRTDGWMKGGQAKLALATQSDLNRRLEGITAAPYT